MSSTYWDFSSISLRLPDASNLNKRMFSVHVVILPTKTYKAVFCNVGGQSADESPVVCGRTPEKERQTDVIEVQQLLQQRWQGFIR